jgi:hypothetical protein
MDYLVEVQVGRVAVIGDGHPAIFPVDGILDGDQILYRTDEDTDSIAGLTSVAFEVDHIDGTSRQRWSVLVQRAGRRYWRRHLREVANGFVVGPWTLGRPESAIAGLLSDRPGSPAAGYASNLANSRRVESRGPIQSGRSAKLSPTPSSR